MTTLPEPLVVQQGISPSEAPLPIYRWPPGFAGDLARAIYHSSFVPIPQMAIAATLGLLAGVCGRAYRTRTDADLSIFMILVAEAGIGKDAIHRGIPDMLELSGVPDARGFAKAENFVSGPALHKEIIRNPGFLNLQSEFGQKLKRIAEGRDTNMQTFKAVLLSAYNSKHLEGLAYSTDETFKDGVAYPCLSILGETTPEMYLRCLTPDMAADGFLSRFLTISYQGPKPYSVADKLSLHLEPEDLDHWQKLVAHASGFHSQFMPPVPPTTVTMTVDAYDSLRTFDLDCTDSFNATSNPWEKQAWVRAHLKVLKIAALLAVADNHTAPQIDIGHVAWAKLLVQDDIETFRQHAQSGNVGNDDAARERRMLTFIKEYFRAPIPASYRIPDAMRTNGIVARKYLQLRTQTLPLFADHRLGATRALDETLRSLVDSGYLMDVEKRALSEGYNYQGKAYRVLELPR